MRMNDLTNEQRQDPAERVTNTLPYDRAWWVLLGACLCMFCGGASVVYYTLSFDDEPNVQSHGKKIRHRIGFAFFLMLATAFTGPVFAATLKQIGTIAVPGKKLKNFDISFVDQAGGLYYLADRSNGAIDIFDTKDDTFVGRVGSFVGAVMKDGKVDNETSGPDGVLIAGTEIWAGDGDSTIKIIDLAAHKTTATISTGGKTRLDEMALDPKDQVIIGVNNAEDPPFATLLSTKPGHAVIGKIVFPNATDGAEQPAYNPNDGMFYVSIPEFDKDPKKGGVAVIDPKTGKLVRTMPVSGCHPAGLAFGPNGNFVLGCTADGKEMPATTTIMNATTGTVVAIVAGIGGEDMVNYNAKNGQYYTASSSNPGGPVLGVIDAKTNTLVQTIPIKGGVPHSVASSEATGHVFVPVGALGGGDGMIHVYAPTL
jgi:DNA-binding beta-propeller fold protein YncE